MPKYLPRMCNKLFNGKYACASSHISTQVYVIRRNETLYIFQHFIKFFYHFIGLHEEPANKLGVDGL